MDNILVSKSAGTKTAFHTIDFHPRGIFCWSFKTKAVSRDNICKQLLGKHSCQSCDINYFEITLPPHNCLLVNLSVIVRVVPGIHL